MVRVHFISNCSHGTEDWKSRLRREKGKCLMNFRSGTAARREVKLTNLLGIYHSGCPSLLLFVLTSPYIECSASQCWAWVKR